MTLTDLDPTEQLSVKGVRDAAPKSQGLTLTAPCLKALPAMLLRPLSFFHKEF